MNNRYLGKLTSDHYQAPIDFGVLTGQYSTLDILTSGNLYAPTGRIGQSSGVIEFFYLEMTNCSPRGALYIFGGPIDPPAQNAPRDFTAEQMDKFVGLIGINFADYTLGSIDIVRVEVSIPYVTQPDSNGLYFVFVQNTADTFFSSSRVKGYFTLKRD